VATGLNFGLSVVAFPPNWTVWRAAGTALHECNTHLQRGYGKYYSVLYALNIPEKAVHFNIHTEFSSD